MIRGAQHGETTARDARERMRVRGWLFENRIGSRNDTEATITYPCHGRTCSGHPDKRGTVANPSGSPGHRRAEATPFFERLCPVMTIEVNRPSPGRPDERFRGTPPIRAGKSPSPARHARDLSPQGRGEVKVLTFLYGILP